MKRVFLAVLLALPLCAIPLPKHPSRAQVMNSCIAKLTVEERSALQRTKNAREAAEILIAVYDKSINYWATTFARIRTDGEFMCEFAQAHGLPMNFDACSDYACAKGKPFFAAQDELKAFLEKP